MALRRFFYKKGFSFSHCERRSITIFNVQSQCVCKREILWSPLFSSSPVTCTQVSTGLFPAASSVISPSCGLAAPHLQQLAAAGPRAPTLSDGSRRPAECCGIPRGSRCPTSDAATDGDTVLSRPAPSCLEQLSVK